MKEINTSNKQIGINMIANIVAYSSNLIVSFIITPFLINTIGKETYGFYPMANSIVSYMSILMNALNTMASRFVTIALVKQKMDDANKYFSSVLAANSILGCILIIPMIIFVTFIENFMNVPINSIAAIKMLFTLVFSSALINVFAAVFGIATFAKNRIDLRSFREIVTGILRLVLFLVLYKFLKPSIVYVGVVAVVIAIVNTIFQVFYTKKLIPEITIHFSFISWRYIVELLGSSIWNAINSLGQSFLVGMTIILSNILYGASASGSCSIVQIIPNFISGVISMLVGVFFPMITYHYAKNDMINLVKDLKKTQKIIGCVSCATIVVFSVLAEDFYSLWTPLEDASMLSRLSLFMILPQIFVACFWELTNLNIVLNKVKIPALITIITGGLNILTVVLIDKLMHPGVIIVPIISAILQIIWIGGFMPIYACKNLNVKWFTFYPILCRAFICTVPTIVIIKFFKQFIQINSWIKFILFGGVMGVLGLVIFSVGMLGFEQIKKYIKDFNKKINIKQC